MRGDINEVVIFCISNYFDWKLLNMDKIPPGHFRNEHSFSILLGTGSFRTTRGGFFPLQNES